LEEGADGSVDDGPGDVFDLLPVAGACGEDEEIFSVAEFLIALEGAEDGVEEFGVAWIGGWEARSGELLEEGVEEGGFAELKLEGDSCGGDHANGDGLAVGEIVVGAQLEGMAEGVAEIEDIADAQLVEFVLLDDGGFELDAACDDFDEGLWVELEDFFEGWAFEGLVEGGVADKAILDDFGEAGPEFALRQGAQESEVAEDEFGLGEGSHDVFDAAEVDGDLAANARIDGGKEGGGDLDEGDAAAVDRGGKSSEIADDAPAEEEDEGGGAGVWEVLEEGGAGFGELLPVFAFL
jgi:hypothetical protein